MTRALPPSAGAIVALLLVLGASLQLAGPGSAWHGGGLVLLDTVAPAGESLSPYSPPVKIHHGRLVATCPAPALIFWEQSNVTYDDDHVRYCLGEMGMDLPWQGSGAGYAVRTLSAAPVHVRVTGEPGWPATPVDPREHAFLWVLDSTQYFGVTKVGSFVMQRDMTDVSIYLDAVLGTVDLYDTTDTPPRHVAMMGSPGEERPIEDLRAGRSYAVHFVMGGFAQVETLVNGQVAILGTYAG